MTMNPNLFIVGAAKAGTTSLYSVLRESADVFMPTLKEPHHFSCVDPGRHAGLLTVVRDRAEYLALFEGRSERVLGEASTSYLCEPGTADRIAAVSPDARIIAVLRDPIQRAHSHYLNDVREGIQSEPFEDLLRGALDRRPERWPEKYVGYGLYADALARYLDVFGANVHVVMFDELSAKMPAVVARLFRFLDLPLPDDLASLNAHENAFARPRFRWSSAAMSNGPARLAARTLLPAGGRRLARRVLLSAAGAPALSLQTEGLLRDLYRDDTIALEELLGRSLPCSSRVLGGLRHREARAS